MRARKHQTRGHPDQLMVPKNVIPRSRSVFERGEESGSSWLFLANRYIPHSAGNHGVWDDRVCVLEGTVLTVPLSAAPETGFSR